MPAVPPLQEEKNLMKTIKILNWVSLILLVVGALNWAIVGMANYNLVGAMMRGHRSAGAITMYVFIGLAALWLIVSVIITKGRIALWDSPEDMQRREHQGTL